MVSSFANKAAIDQMYYYTYTGHSQPNGLYSDNIVVKTQYTSGKVFVDFVSKWLLYFAL